ncbi:hypothetical protein B0H11DRAFT_1956809 [Mycena galericulata]|nr:hypothetical protein B0H11DRAFT_1956809 [Mycena galericulata]
MNFSQFAHASKQYTRCVFRSRAISRTSLLLPFASTLEPTSTTPIYAGLTRRTRAANLCMVCTKWSSRATIKRRRAFRYCEAGSVRINRLSLTRVLINPTHLRIRIPDAQMDGARFEGGGFETSAAGYIWPAGSLTRTRADPENPTLTGCIVLTH